VKCTGARAFVGAAAPATSGQVDVHVHQAGDEELAASVDAPRVPGRLDFTDGDARDAIALHQNPCVGHGGTPCAVDECDVLDQQGRLGAERRV